jgi:hypothetical protein
MHKHEPDLFWRVVVLTYFAAIGTLFSFLALRGAVRNYLRDRAAGSAAANPQ